MRGAYTFVGENRSPTARARNWTWRDGHLAAKPLFEALDAIGVDPSRQEFLNLFVDGAFRVRRAAVAALRSCRRVVVALGKRVAQALEALGIPHVRLVHPAARGKIRKRSRYRRHVREVLGVV